MGGILEGNAVLMNSIKARFPHQGYIAGIRCLKPPREEGRNSISTDYTHLHQRAVVHRHVGQRREERTRRKRKEEMER